MKENFVVKKDTLYYGLKLLAYSSEMDGLKDSLYDVLDIVKANQPDINISIPDFVNAVESLEKAINSLNEAVYMDSTCADMEEPLSEKGENEYLAMLYGD